MQRKIAILMVVMGTVALVMSGCGGGSGGPGDATVAGTASVSGTVYSPAEDVSIQTAQAGDGGVPVPNCPVEVRAETEGRRLASGSTDGAGQYRFSGLPADETVVIEADTPNGIRLMSRARLHDGSCRADINGETTLAAVCAREALGEGNGPWEEQAGNTVAEECLRYQAQNGSTGEQGQGNGPNFADADEVALSAGDLLADAAAAALERARATRSETDCERAVTMLRAHLRERYENHTGWTEALVQRLVAALREGSISEEHAARVLSRIMHREITAEQVQRALRYLWERLGIGDPERDPEVAEIVAALTVAQGNSAMLRLGTSAAAEELTAALAE